MTPKVRFPVVDGFKVCSKCGERKPTDQYFRRKGSATGFRPTCKGCQNEDRRRWHQENPEKSAATRRRRRMRLVYGLDPEAVAALTARCAICGASDVRIEIDHDHTTDLVRGGLCRSCNIGLGNFRDDPALLVSAFRYLNRHFRESHGLPEPSEVSA